MHCPVHERSVEPISFPDRLGLCCVLVRHCYHYNACLSLPGICIPQTTDPPQRSIIPNWLIWFIVVALQPGLYSALDLSRGAVSIYHARGYRSNSYQRSDDTTRKPPREPTQGGFFFAMRLIFIWLINVNLQPQTCLFPSFSPSLWRFLLPSEPLSIGHFHLQLPGIVR